MITVFGADWCEDTRRSRRHLRRLAVAHRYLNVDEDLDALERAKALNAGERRTPVIDLGLGGPPFVEPDNATLTRALVDNQLLTAERADELLSIQNVGDAERAARTAGGLVLMALAAVSPRALRWPLRLAGAFFAATGVTGWCPAYHSAGVTSLGGPCDRPDEAVRRSWLEARRAG